MVGVHDDLVISVNLIILACSLILRRRRALEGRRRRFWVRPSWFYRNAEGQMSAVGLPFTLYGIFVLLKVSILYGVYFLHLRSTIQDWTLAHGVGLVPQHDGDSDSSLHLPQSLRGQLRPIPSEWGQPSPSTFRPRPEWSTSQERRNPFPDVHRVHRRRRGIGLIASSEPAFPLERWTGSSNRPTLSGSEPMSGSTPVGRLEDFDLAEDVSAAVVALVSGPRGSGSPDTKDLSLRNCSPTGNGYTYSPFGRLEDFDFPEDMSVAVAALMNRPRGSDSPNSEDRLLRNRSSAESGSTFTPLRRLDGFDLPVDKSVALEALMSRARGSGSLDVGDLVLSESSPALEKELEGGSQLQRNVVVSEHMASSLSAGSPSP